MLNAELAKLKYPEIGSDHWRYMGTVKTTNNWGMMVGKSIKMVWRVNG